MSNTSVPDSALIGWVQLMRSHHDTVRNAEHLHALGAMSAQQRYTTVSLAQDAIRLCHMTLEQTVPFTRWDSAYVGYLQTPAPRQYARGIVTAVEYWDDFLRYASGVTL